MLRTDVADRLRETRGEDGYLLPAYGGYCFAGVAATAFSVLGADLGRTLPADVFRDVDTDVDRVVLVLLDGFGFEQWRRYRGTHPVLERLSERATVTPLTSVYPSETAAAITTLHTGTLPVEHGLLGWYGYYREVGAPLMTLPFETVDGDPAPAVFGDAADPRMLFDGDPLYGRAAAAGVTSRLFQPESTVGTAYTELTTGGAATTGYRNVADLMVRLRRACERADGPTYLYGYVPNVDTAAHLAGTTSEQYRAQLAMVLDCLGRELVEALDPAAAERTLLIVTADHGEVDTARSVDLGAIDGLRERYRRDAAGEPILPSGGARNVQFHLEDGAAPAVRELIEREFEAAVFTREAAARRELFGDREPGAGFQRRVGDLIVAPREVSAWYLDRPLEYVGMHGGLAPEEMLVPFAAATVSGLRG